MLEALYNKWKSGTVLGQNPSVQQPIPAFINSAEALDMLHEHIINNDTIGIHCDVDLDGIGSGYIARRFISCLSNKLPFCVINKGKEHGIKQRHSEFLNKLNIGLFIIVDSSSNELDNIKKFNCDVLVIDHHEVDHKEYSGYTNDEKHRFIIVNNTIDNNKNESINEWLRNTNPQSKIFLDKYSADSRMSCGVVIYELLRLYEEAYTTGPLLENMLLYQWSGVTLFTDAISLLNERNQWYMDNTVHSRFVEPTLSSLLHELNKFNITLDKSFINYTLAPTFNRAIRANANAEALKIVMEEPYNVNRLKQYREIQDWSISEGVKQAIIGDSYCKVKLNDTGINPNYTGVIAGRVCDDNKKNSIAYVVSNGIAKGSFRGRSSKADYRSSFNSYSNDVLAQGHKQAFGFEAKEEDLDNIMARLTEVEDTGIDDKYYLTAGNLPDNIKGVYHINDIEEFKRQGGIMMLAIGNSKVASDEQINITVNSAEAKLLEQRGQLYIYNILGLTCKAFKEIEPGIINIYAEYSKTVEFYIK